MICSFVTYPMIFNKDFLSKMSITLKSIVVVDELVRQTAKWRISKDILKTTCIFKKHICMCN